MSTYSLKSCFVKPKHIEGIAGDAFCKINLSNLDNLISLETLKVGKETKKIMLDSKLKQSEIDLFK